VAVAYIFDALNGKKKHCVDTDTSIYCDRWITDEWDWMRKADICWIAIYYSTRFLNFCFQLLYSVSALIEQCWIMWIGCMKMQLLGMLKVSSSSNIVFKHIRSDINFS